MQLKPRRLLALVALGTVVLASACGDPDDAAGGPSASDDRGTTTVVDEAAPGAAAVRDAATRSAEQDSVSMELVMTMDGETASTIRTQGTADGTRARIQMEAGPIGTMEILLVDEAYYYAIPGLPDGKQWMRMGFDELEQMSGMDMDAAMGQDPSQAFQTLSSVSDDVQVIGEEDVAGIPTTHYRFSADVQALMQNAIDSGVLSREAAESSGLLEGGTEMDVWIDADGLARRMVYELAIDQSVAGPGAPGTIGYDFTFTGYGEPVDVTAPAPDTVVSMDEMMGSASATFDQLPQGS